MLDIPEYLRSKLVEDISSVYIGSWPPHAPNAIAIRLWDGQNQEYFGQRTIFVPTVLFLIRHEEYAPAMGWCKFIKSKFHQYRSDEIAQMSMRGDILHLGRNAERLHEFQMMFNIMVRE